MKDKSYKDLRKSKELDVKLQKLKKGHGVSLETRKSVAAIGLIAGAVILLLARWSMAGPAGKVIFNLLDRLFGWGYYLLPILALCMALFFLTNREQKFLLFTFIGAALFALSGLGFIDILAPGKGGLVGAAAGMLEIPFGKTAAIIIASALMAASALIAFNTSLKLPQLKKAKVQKESPDIDAMVAEAETKALDENESDDEEAEEKPRKSKENDAAAETKKAPLLEPVIKTELTAAPGKLSRVKSMEFKNYVVPPASLLKSSVEKPTSGDLRANANIIKRTLEGFGIAVEMGEINIGPKVTRYTLKPAEGVKLARIIALNQDLALALAAHPIRIEAPIPGKSLVGVEVPNKSAALVRLGSLMAYPEFASGGPLTFILGRDVSGEPIFGNIEKMPHLLIAGSTGSGKSVAIHSLLVSLLYKNSPEMLRLVLIDPKRVELSIYEGIPHLVSSVVTESKKSVGVFRWAIQEMDRRYELLLAAGSRDIGSYHKNGHGERELLPYIVIVVDELADLMATYGREVESSVVRLAQMARATGIHLVLSTQRPSVEVITGLIKANITARIALQVASQIDSRTILDSAGAEKLLGGGDLLFISSEFSKPKRIQGAYISEEEINGVAKFIRDNNELAESIASSIDGRANELAPEGGNEGKELFDEFSGDNEKDPLYEDALNVVRELQKASASLLQRRLQIGYARAARLLDIMEKEGLIGPGDGAKPREILM